MKRQDIVRETRLQPLLDLFSMVMVLDRGLNLVFASDTLLKYMPVLADRPTLFEAFDVVRPGSVTSFADIELNLHSLFLLTATDHTFAIRGQVVTPTDGDCGFLVFCGAPWLSWMTGNYPERQLGLKDFSPQDAQIDQLFYMETESRMVEDLERLNAELQNAKRKLEAAEAARTAFFTQMSHEMRTPLNGVVSALSLMREQGLQGHAEQLLDLASKSSENLMQVVNYVLDVSKLESSDVAHTEVIFNLRDLVQSVTDIVQARALEKHLSLQSQVSDDLAKSYLGDAPRMRQVLLNLLINAIKFTERGTVSLTVGAACSEGQTLRIEVADTGVGIPKGAQGRIFEPFTTLEQSVPGVSNEGTGLGLDIARRNIDAMGGRIGVASSPEVGSTFWIELPFEAAQSDDDPAISVPGSPLEPDWLSGRVLLVDDNETNLMLGAMILESMGLSVLKASSGETAVAFALSKDVDLVLMDISMPGMDGYEATNLIRKELSAEALPVVALTAYACSEEQAKSKAIGMNDYLTKPIERDRLSAVLSRWLPLTSRAGSATDDQLDLPIIETMLQQIGKENLGTVINKFCDEAAGRWRALKSAPSSAELAREAHTLASTCRSFGLPASADRLQGIEATAKAGGTLADVEGVADIGVGLEQNLQALRAFHELLTS